MTLLLCKSSDVSTWLQHTKSSRNQEGNIGCLFGALAPEGSLVAMMQVEQKPQNNPNIVEIAAGYGAFNILLQALAAAVFKQLAQNLGFEGSAKDSAGANSSRNLLFPMLLPTKVFS
ncbi:MAG: hypothetical protein MK098_04505 [Marinovum sp.]|nr:hypothetical protein [Marinovum sp.]